MNKDGVKPGSILPEKRFNIMLANIAWVMRGEGQNNLKMTKGRENPWKGKEIGCTPKWLVEV